MLAWELHNALHYLMLFLFILFFLFLSIATRYVRLIRKKYPRIPLANVHICPICGVRVVPERGTKNIFLFPYLFKSLRHYEKYHLDIAIHARKARIIQSLSINSGIFCVILVLALRSVETLVVELSFEEYVLHFTSAFIGGSIFIWLLIALFLYKILPGWEVGKIDQLGKVKS